MIKKAIQGNPLPVYGEGRNVRDWIYVSDHCRAIDVILHKGADGNVYNVGGNEEWRNIDLVRLICRKLDVPESQIVHVEDRKGHDLRYAIDSSKLQTELGWKAKVPFEDGLAKTVQWYLG